MMTFKVSVDFEFCISTFPVEFSEICLEVQRLRQELGPLIVKTLIRKLEVHSLETDLSLLGAQRHDYRRRIFNTCIGRLELNLLRVRPVGEKPRYAISRTVLLESGCYTKDSFESAVSLLPLLSYRRSSAESRNLTSSGPTKSTLHRRVKDLEPLLDKHPENEAPGYRYLFVDGTGVRIQDWAWTDAGLTRFFESSELRIVYASKGLKEPAEVVGRWLKDTSWEEIAKETYHRIRAADIIQLTTDGEDGIEAAFLRPGMRFQRCTTHAWRSFKQSLYLDGLSQDERATFMKKLYSIPVFDCAVKANLESLKPEDRDTIAQQLQKSETDLTELQQFMKNKGYRKAAIYLENLTNPLLSFMRSWLKDGKESPTTNNIPENRFSLIKNRIRSIGKRWSEDGVLRLVDLAIHKLFPGYDWKEFWNQVMPRTNRITGYIVAIR